ncbi:hypothetical protein DPMN_118803 [Dreissena polymorpha]|uniref:Uncharacterized protein n=1 Tax=Dreissena polymorpha TaxID=45954 RepID=A0A9D4GHP0_DREPO|nr:hypothetical protein DPMN_174891 [Dreissena polymorpha]KAH3817270.1 hypothetical protein DPMN_118803 [Dreissena polymorpha]
MFFDSQNQFQTNYIYREKTAPPPKSHIFPPILTIFELVHEINKTNILTNLVRKTAPPPGGHVFQPTRTIFELKKRHIIYTNILANDLNSVEIHEDRARNAVSSVHKAKFHDGHRSIKYHH